MLSRHRRVPPLGSGTQTRMLSRYIGIITACVAIVASLFTLFTVGDEPADLKVLIGFCIGLSAIILPLQIEAVIRLVERASTQERYGKLLAIVEDYPNLLPAITRTAEASVEILKESRVAPFKQRVPELLNETQVRLQELAQGHLYIAGGDKTLLTAVFADAKRLIQGTTDAKDTVWWQQATGREFLELNRALIKKNKKKNKVERVCDGVPVM